MQVRELKPRKAKYGIEVKSNLVPFDYLQLCHVSAKLEGTFPLGEGHWSISTKNAYGLFVVTYYTDNINTYHFLLKEFKHEHT